MQKNHYDLSMETYADIDNKLAAAQLAIGQSSNLAQLCLTYTYNFDDKKYLDYVCILSVVAQIAIDNAKRTYNININDEIARIQNDIDVNINGLPAFWQLTKKNKCKTKSSERRNEKRNELKVKIRQQINDDLICPMNFLYAINFNRANKKRTIPIDEFFVKQKTNNEYRKNRKVEQLIERYIGKLYSKRILSDEISYSDFLLLEDDFNELVNEIKKIYISKNYAPLMSFLINRAFKLTPNSNRKQDILKTEKNKVILLKTLYSVNPDVFISCFVGKNSIDLKNTLV